VLVSAAAEPRFSGVPLPPLARKALAELIGTAVLVAGVVGSGIAASRLSAGDVGLQLLENTVATVGVLMAVILALGPVSGAHLNPVVTLATRWFGGVTTREVLAYLPAQVAGACIGSVVANVMFDLRAIDLSTKHRASGAHLVAEIVATYGLLLVIFGVVRSGRSTAAPFAVGAYIGGAYFFTSSTSFANPAVTIGRTLSNTFAGIAPAAVPGFIAAQVLGAAIAVACVTVLYPDISGAADDVVIPHAPPQAA